MTDRRLTQHAMGLTWEDCEPPVDDSVLDELERKLGVVLPHDFREFMKLCHGGNPVERIDFRYPNRYFAPYFGLGGSCLGGLLTLYGDDDASSILGTMELLSHEDQLPEGLVPFGEDGGGDMMCLDYRGDPEHPRVVYWAHEEEKEESVTPLADSFREFIDMLEPPSIYTQQLMSVTWDFCKPPVDDALLDSLERSFEVVFPGDFRELMKLCHGGFPIERDRFHYPNPWVHSYVPMKASLGVLLALHESAMDGVVRTAERLVADSELFRGVIPFAHASSREHDRRPDLVCLDYREDPDHPRVVYWMPLPIKKIATVPLVDSVTDLVAMLETEPTVLEEFIGPRASVFVRAHEDGKYVDQWHGNIDYFGELPLWLKGAREGPQWTFRRLDDREMWVPAGDEPAQVTVAHGREHPLGIPVTAWADSLGANQLDISMTARPGLE